MAKFITNAKFNKFMSQVQAKLTTEECAELKTQLQPHLIERVQNLSAQKDFESNIKNPSTINCIKAVQIPLKYPLLIKSFIKPIEEILKYKPFLGKMVENNLDMLLQKAKAKEKSAIGLCQEINTSVTITETRLKDVADNEAVELWINGTPSAIKLFQAKHGLRKVNGELIFSEVSRQFAKATGSEFTFHLLCKSLGPKELTLILSNDTISDDLKDLIVSKLDAYHSHYSFTMVVAEHYKKNRK